MDTAGSIGSIALDHYGLVGFERHPAGTVMIVGVALVAVFRQPHVRLRHKGLSMLFLYGFALLAGFASAVEPGQNASLAKSFARPLLAGVVSLLASIATIAVLMLVTRNFGRLGADRLAEVPWWAWLGGLLSAGLTMAQLYIADKIGAATFLGLIVTGGVITSILLDHFGLVGFNVHPASLWRILGGVLMIGGVGLVARF